MTTTTTIVHMRHVRAARLAGAGVLCAPGIRSWCAAKGVDLRRLSHEGVPLCDFEHLRDDPFANRAIAIAEAEARADA